MFQPSIYSEGYREPAYGFAPLALIIPAVTSLIPVIGNIGKKKREAKRAEEAATAEAQRQQQLQFQAQMNTQARNTRLLLFGGGALVFGVAAVTLWKSRR